MSTAAKKTAIGNSNVKTFPVKSENDKLASELKAVKSENRKVLLALEALEAQKQQQYRQQRPHHQRSGAPEAQKRREVKKKPSQTTAWTLSDNTKSSMHEAIQHANKILAATSETIVSMAFAPLPPISEFAATKERASFDDAGEWEDVDEFSVASTTTSYTYGNEDVNDEGGIEEVLKEYVYGAPLVKRSHRGLLTTPSKLARGALKSTRHFRRQPKRPSTSKTSMIGTINDAIDEAAINIADTIDEAAFTMLDTTCIDEAWPI